MGKSKVQAKPVKADKVATKPAPAGKPKSEVISKKSSKKVKEPESSEEDSDEESEDSASEDSSASDDESEVDSKKKPVANGKAKDESESEEDSDDSDSSEDESSKKAKPAVNGKAKSNGVAAKEAEAESSEESDSSDEDSDEDDEKQPAAATKKAEKDDEEDDEDSDSDSGSDSSDDSEDDEEEQEKPASKKRKAEEDAAPQAKKQKSELTGNESKNLFVGSLSWNIDDAYLASEFEKFGEIVRANVVTDRESGRSKGFGYVEFTNIEDAINAHKEMTGAEIDGRAINIDFSQPRADRGSGAQRQQDRSKSFGDQASPPSDTLFVGNIAFAADENALSEAFSPFGDIKGIRLPTNPDDGNIKGFGYVTFGSVEEATAAFEGMQGGYVAGRPIRVDFSQPRQNNGDSRGGFGRGGRGGRGGFGDRGGRGRGGFGGRGRGGDRGGRGGRGNFSTNRGGFNAAQGKKVTF